MNHGMRVEVDHKVFGKQIHRNVTEIHYKYDVNGKMVAFESDIHSTGRTDKVADILEMEVMPETELAESF